MNRIRWAALAAVAGLGLLSGCTSCGNGGCPREGWFSRLTSRSRNAVPCEVCEPCAGPSCGPTCEGPALFDQGPGGVPALGPNGVPVLPPPTAVQPAVPPLATPPRVEPQPAQPVPAEPSSRRK